MKTSNYNCCSVTEAHLPCGGHDLPAKLYMRAGGCMIPIRLVAAGTEVEQVNLRREENGSFTAVAHDAVCWVCEREVSAPSELVAVASVA